MRIALRRPADLTVLALALAVAALVSWPAASAAPPSSVGELARPLLPLAGPVR